MNKLFLSVIIALSAASNIVCEEAKQPTTSEVLYEAIQTYNAEKFAVALKDKDSMCRYEKQSLVHMMLLQQLFPSKHTVIIPETTDSTLLPVLGVTLSASLFLAGFILKVMAKDLMPLSHLYTFCGLGAATGAVSAYPLYKSMETDKKNEEHRQAAISQIQKINQERADSLTTMMESLDKTPTKTCCE